MKRLFCVMAVLLLLCLQPMQVMANIPYVLEDVYLTVFLDSDAFAIRQDTDPSASVFEYLGLDPYETLRQMKEKNLVIDAISLENQYEFRIMRDDTLELDIFSLNEFTTEEWTKLASRLRRVSTWCR